MPNSGHWLIQSVGLLQVHTFAVASSDADTTTSLSPWSLTAVTCSRFGRKGQLGDHGGSFGGCLKITHLFLIISMDLGFRCWNICEILKMFKDVLRLSLVLSHASPRTFLEWPTIVCTFFCFWALYRTTCGGLRLAMKHITTASWHKELPGSQRHQWQSCLRLPRDGRILQESQLQAHRLRKGTSKQAENWQIFCAIPKWNTLL